MGREERPDFKPVTINNITEFVSEFPKEGATELWEIVNTTLDAHPMHTHLASFQILNRQNYDAKGFTAAYVWPSVRGRPPCGKEPSQRHFESTPRRTRAPPIRGKLGR